MTTQTTPPGRPRQLHLNAFLMETGHHEASWRLPSSPPNASYDLDHWIRLARLAEDAGFDSLFLADGVARHGNGAHRDPGQIEPLTLLTALAAVTDRIGLIATVSTTYNEPYNLARRLASVDIVSGGRVGWNIVTSGSEQEAANFGLTELPSSRARYARAEEFLEVVTRLWDSWGDDAHVGDKATGTWGDTSRIHDVEHEGEHFRVRGGLNVPRPPQGWPVLVQAGSSPSGRAFAGRWAEAVFTASQTLAGAQEFYADVKQRAAAEGRDPDHVLVLPGLVPIIGLTEREAQEKAQLLDDLRVPEYGLLALAAHLDADPSELVLDEPLPDHVVQREQREGFISRAQLIIDFATEEHLTVRQILSRLGGGRGHHVLIGTPVQVADTIEEWFDHGAADGFNIMGAALPSGLEDFVVHVLPLLRERGLFREDYPGTTLRDSFGLPRPANQFEAGQTPASGGTRATDTLTGVRT